MVKIQNIYGTILQRPHEFYYQYYRMTSCFTNYVGFEMKVEKVGKRNPSSFSLRKSQFDMFVLLREECYFYFFLLQIAYSKLKQCLKYGCLLSNRQILIFGTNSYCCVTALGSQPVSVGDHRSILLGTLLLTFCLLEQLEVLFGFHFS